MSRSGPDEDDEKSSNKFPQKRFFNKTNLGNPIAGRQCNRYTNNSRHQLNEKEESDRAQMRSRC